MGAAPARCAPRRRSPRVASVLARAAARRCVLAALPSCPRRWTRAGGRLPGASARLNVAPSSCSPFGPRISSTSLGELARGDTAAGRGVVLRTSPHGPVYASRPCPVLPSLNTRLAVTWVSALLLVCRSNRRSRPDVLVPTAALQTTLIAALFLVDGCPGRRRGPRGDVAAQAFRSACVVRSRVAIPAPRSSGTCALPGRRRRIPVGWIVAGHSRRLSLVRHMEFG